MAPAEVRLGGLRGTKDRTDLKCLMKLVPRIFDNPFGIFSTPLPAVVHRNLRPYSVFRRAKLTPLAG